MAVAIGLVPMPYLTGVTPPIDDVTAGSHDALADDRTSLRIAINGFAPPAIGRIEALPEWADVGAAVVFSRITELSRAHKVGRG
jgi:hypothetical protein